MLQRSEAAADAQAAGRQNRKRTGQKFMQLRKLEQEEHRNTRSLWEEVFREDSKEFLDYYYFIKTKENEIYVIEEETEIRAMLHLNPYRVRVGERIFDSRYIIAVATSKPYRSRGFMGNLLRRSMQDMYEKKLPFTFLMPAAEAIYTPYDFRFVYDQRQGEMKIPAAVKKANDRDAAMGDARQLAGFFEHYVSSDWQVVTVRDETYYQTRILEQQSENGGIRMLMKEDGSLAGMYCYGIEPDGKIAVLEPSILPGYEGEFSLSLAGLVKKGGEANILACPDNLVSCLASEMKKPLIMLRILHLPTMLESVSVSAGQKLNCSFAVLDPLLKKNSGIYRLESEGATKVKVRETEDSQGVFTIAALTEFLFGYKSLEEVRHQEGVYLTEELILELRKIKVFDQIFLNEIV